jgi:rubrerythrin
MQTAWSEEVNDQAVYEAYARQEDIVGLGHVASLFRSTAGSEGIHAQIEFAMIRSMSESTSPAVQTPVVERTEKNLAAAVAGEERQRHRTYPALAHRARQQKLGRTLQALIRIQGAEEQHIAILNRVRSGIRQAVPSEDRYFYVCSTCGYIAEEITFDMCPNCFDAAERFEMIS